ncbi:hypothetical protein EUGRSUZ_L00096 [Eucalyptus grandis]|uniref:Uncharacterized protein n=2 Tax=Eucalyptus grandis TaxID=71139 RepID=A0ACC3L554_EUCGR|nr:hypothetical protein EUGRSUZ_L00096 [Eucalyptus grandis]
MLLALAETTVELVAVTIKVDTTRSILRTFAFWVPKYPAYLSNIVSFMLKYFDNERVGVKCLAVFSY